MAIYLIARLIKRISLFKMSYYPEPDTSVHTSEIAKEFDLASLKLDVDKLDIDKLKAVPIDLS